MTAVAAPSDTPAHSRVAAIGEPALVRGFALAGALVLAAEQPADVAGAWRSVPDDVGLVVLTAQAAQVLGDELHPERAWPLVAVMR